MKACTNLQAVLFFPVRPRITGLSVLMKAIRGRSTRLSNCKRKNSGARQQTNGHACHTAAASSVHENCKQSRFVLDKNHVETMRCTQATEYLRVQPLYASLFAEPESNRNRDREFRRVACGTGSMMMSQHMHTGGASLDSAHLRVLGGRAIACSER